MGSFVYSADLEKPENLLMTILGQACTRNSPPLYVQHPIDHTLCKKHHGEKGIFA